MVENLEDNKFINTCWIPLVRVMSVNAGIWMQLLLQKVPGINFNYVFILHMMENAFFFNNYWYHMEKFLIKKL